MNEQQKTARERAEVMLAFSEGKVVESARLDDTGWERDYTPQWDWLNFNYRIPRSQPKKLVPFTWEDRDELMGKWVQNGKNYRIQMIREINILGISLREPTVYFDTLLNEFTFYPSGEPCGKWVVGE